MIAPVLVRELQSPWLVRIVRGVGRFIGVLPLETAEGTEVGQAFGLPRTSESHVGSKYTEKPNDYTLQSCIKSYIKSISFWFVSFSRFTIVFYNWQVICNGLEYTLKSFM